MAQRIERDFPRAVVDALYASSDGKDLLVVALDSIHIVRRRWLGGPAVRSYARDEILQVIPLVEHPYGAVSYSLRIDLKSGASEIFLFDLSIHGGSEFYESEMHAACRNFL